MKGNIVIVYTKEMSLDAEKLKVKKYWDDRPCNIKHSKEKLNSVRYFQEVSSRKYFVESHILDFAEFSKYKGKKILEIGCGIGTAMQSFSENGAIYHGVDLSSESIRIAKIRADKFKLENIKLMVADAENLSNEITIETFDLIYSFGVLHHTPNPLKAFEQLKFFAKPGTEIKIMLYNKFSTKAFGLFIKYGWKTNFNFNQAVALQSEAQFGSPYTYTYSKKDVRKIAKIAGFTLKRVYCRHIFPYKIPEYRDYLFKKRFYWKILPLWLFRELEKKLGWHLLIEGFFEQNQTQ